MRPEIRGLLAAFFSLAGCDVYNQELIDDALGPGGSGIGATGTVTGGGTGGNFGGTGGNFGGTGGSFGGTSGTAGSPTGGTSAAGGTAGGAGGSGRGGGGSDGEGGGGDSGSTSDAGRGGSSMGGTAGGAGSGAIGGMPGESGAGAVGGAGSGGSAGSGAGASGAGAGGAGAGGAGSGGSAAGMAGAGGASEVCTGCARLSVPLAASGDKAHFTISFPAATDLSAATITFRVARYAGTGGWFKGYIQEGSPNFLYQDSVATTIASIGASMQTISWDVATAGTAANKTMIRRIGVEISGGGGGSFTSPTVIYVDSITIAGSTLAMSSFTFDTSAAVYATPTSEGPNNVIWLNNYSGDTNVTGAALSWLGP